MYVTMYSTFVQYIHFIIYTEYIYIYIYIFFHLGKKKINFFISYIHTYIHMYEYVQLHTHMLDPPHLGPCADLNWGRPGWGAG